MPGLEPKQLLEYVIAPTLEILDMDSVAARVLILGTAVIESDLRYIHQLGDGPALGLWQVEPATHDDVYKHFLSFRPPLQNIVMAMSSAVQPGNADVMIWNLQYNCAIARLVYWRVPENLPDEDDATGLARYYKEHYNTPEGAADEAAAIPVFENAQRIVASV